MESEKSALKRSFFREYFFYKLRGTLGISITSAVLGFVSCILSGIIVLTMLKMIEDDIKGVSGIYSEPNVPFVFLVAMLGLAGMAVLAIITPIVTFKFYRSRSSMDTIGCLPITYRERFWGDFLSGLAALTVPFSVMAGIGRILLVTAQQKLDRLYDELKSALSSLYFIDNLDLNVSELGVKFYLVMLIVIVAAYATATLVTACCGKAGSAALYSVIALPIIPAIVGLYGIFALNFTKGIFPEEQINVILSCIPPVGTLISDRSLIRGSIDGETFNFTILKNPLLLAIALIFTAAMIAAAYFIGKKRKTERVGNSFAVNIMYHVLTLMMVLAVIGVYFSTNRILGIDLTKVLICAVIALVFYLILEMIQYRNFKAIWKSLIRYACVAVVGFGFLFAAMKTHGFGIGTHLPNQSDIEEITIESYAFGNGGSGVGMVKYRAESAISAILAENRHLIDNFDKISTSSTIYPGDNGMIFTYKLKNGNTVARYYQINDGSLLDDVVNEIKKQPTYEIERLGVLNRDDLTGIRMTFSEYSTETASYGKPVYVKESKIPELAERIKYDIINTERDGNSRNTVGRFTAILPKGDEDEAMSYYHYYTNWYISEYHTRTVEFLNNPDNFYDKEPENTENPGEELEYYIVSYYNYTGGYDIEVNPDELTDLISSAEITFRSDSDSEYAKELMSYFIKEYESDTDERFNVRVYDSDIRYTEPLGIPKDRAEAALKAMMNLIAEQTEMLQ